MSTTPIDLAPVPFSASKSLFWDDGYRITEGHIRQEAGNLVILGHVSFDTDTQEWWFRMLDRIGLRRSFLGPFELRVPVAQIARIKIRKGLFLTNAARSGGVANQKIVVRVRQRSLLAPLAEAKSGVLHLPFVKQHLPAAEALVSRVQQLTQHTRMNSL